MTKKEYIRRAVELATGWRLSDGGFEDDVYESPAGYRGILHATPELLDALAAQLVRQVDLALCSLDWGQLSKPFYKENGPDRTMNTIKAIVDSGVLAANAQKA